MESWCERLERTIERLKEENAKLREENQSLKEGYYNFQIAWEEACEELDRLKDKTTDYDDKGVLCLRTK